MMAYLLSAIRAGNGTLTSRSKRLDKFEASTYVLERGADAWMPVTGS
jgi:hypothetical protein